MRSFYIENSEVKKPVVLLKGSEARHIKNVLRLKPGDTIRLFDGSGFEYEAVIKNLSAAEAGLEIKHKCVAAAESPVQIMVAQAFLKEKKMDSLLRQLCELGMAAWISFFSERSVPKLDARRLTARVQRWEKIAIESFKQCRRSTLPDITAVQSLKEVLQAGQSCDVKYLFWENEIRPLSKILSDNLKQPVKTILIVLGPEGGFAEHEVNLARKSGFKVAGLGPRILRAETAALAACALMQFIFGDLGQKYLDKNGRF